MGWYIPGVHSAWSVKDTIAHLTSCEYVLLDILAEVKGSAHIPTLKRWLRDRESFDVLEVTRRQHKTIYTLLGDYADVHTETLIQMSHLSDELLRQTGLFPGMTRTATWSGSLPPPTTTTSARSASTSPPSATVLYRASRKKSFLGRITDPCPSRQIMRDGQRIDSPGN